MTTAYSSRNPVGGYKAIVFIEVYDIAGGLTAFS